MPKSRLVLTMVQGGFFAVALVFAPLVSGSAQAAPQSNKTFRVGKRMLEGRSKSICVIQGKWADGAPFRYEAWDSCDKMQMRNVTEKDYKDAPSLGEDDKFTVADIPPRAEVIEISNGVSTTLVFRDRRGIQREILSQD